ncbi:GyrI-like domain-containing protein [Algoriphagus sp. CAU 1675]|uniref:GyrI-like domain-containing protein n=1 Tax=Algoriphagus sp. CAU 1675 TaxID=3032597 RepID=UPI0023D9C392|nr:GyrI-like domain-containing protein [Algoriphagus sp. CAU 1675]MDF2158590.1 GyrI-like domain-containing protein [Algoriphagus sp. CAU 1675]
MRIRIKQIKEKKLIGLKLTMNHFEDRSGELWAQFLSKRRLISPFSTQDMICVQNYEKNYFKNLDQGKNFEKWVTLEVQDHKNIPEGMHAFLLEEGLYAVIEPSFFNCTWEALQHLLQYWLPSTDFRLDDRPHLEVFSDRSKIFSKTWEIWIPVKKKKASIPKNPYKQRGLHSKIGFKKPRVLQSNYLTLYTDIHKPKLSGLKLLEKKSPVKTGDLDLFRRKHRGFDFAKTNPDSVFFSKTF